MRVNVNDFLYVPASYMVSLKCFFVLLTKYPDFERVASDKAGFFTYFLEKTPSSFAYYNFFSPTEDKGGNRYVKVQEILHMICENGAGLY